MGRVRSARSSSCRRRLSRTVGGRRVRDRQVDLRVEGAKALQHGGQDVHAHGHAPGEAQGTAVEGPGLGDLRHRLLKLALHSVNRLQEQIARCGEGHPLLAAMENHAAEFLLEKLDLSADRRLGDMHPPGRLGEGAFLGHRAKHLELTQIHPHLLFRCPQCLPCVQLVISEAHNTHCDVLFYTCHRNC